MMKNLTDKILSRGIECLTDEELIAMVIADGANGEDVLEQAAQLLKSCDGSITRLVDVDISRLRMMSGLGKMRALRLKSAAEIGRRIARAKADTYEIITSDGDIVRIMEPQLGGLQYEECWALYLASSGRVLERMRISQGGVQSTVVDCKLIIKRALELLAVQIVLVHNHPSGSAEPSSQDMSLTERVAEAAKLFDIRLLDHVIIARGVHYSFRGHNLIK